MPASETAKGYLKGLEGLLLTAKSNSDRYLYLSKIEKTSKNLRAIHREFVAHATKKLHTDYDRGYFQVLESFVKKLERSGIKEPVVGKQKQDGEL